MIQISSALRLAGLAEPARAWLDRAKILTPDNILLVAAEAEFFLSAGDFEKAAALVAPQGLGERRAAHDVLYGEILLAQGNREAARDAFSAAMTRSQNNPEGAFRLATLSLKKAEADDHSLVVSLREARLQGDEWPSASVEAAYIFAAADDAEGAARLLQEAYLLGYRDADRLRHSPFFANIRETPAYEAVLKAMAEDASVQRGLIVNDARLRSFLETP